MADSINCKEIIVNDEVQGSVLIADDVIASIAALAATDVEGVACMAGNVTKEIAARLGVKDKSKGVRLTLNGEDVKVVLSLMILYGYSLQEVSETVQKKVKDTIENMTGLSVSEVNVNIAGVMTKEEAEANQ